MIKIEPLASHDTTSPSDLHRLLDLPRANSQIVKLDAARQRRQVEPGHRGCRYGRAAGGRRARRRTRSSAIDLALAHELRAGLHEALSLTHARNVQRLPQLDAVASQLPLQLRWLEGEPRLAPVGAGVPGALAKVLIAVETAAQSGTWERLKICSADTCAWAYYDASKNQSRNWCELGCGNKIKTRAYRARRQASVAQSPSTQSRTSGMSSRCSTT
ncbi:MAG: CGNR zinc finger domain-containing protein [Nocardioidaceae bacterium]